MTKFTPTRKIIQFVFAELEKGKSYYWLIASPGLSVDLCTKDPGFDVDLYIKADLRALTSVWLGLSELNHEINNKKIALIGDNRLASTIEQWMVRSSFAA